MESETKEVTKQEVFDLFYGLQLCTRRGGGTSKTKMSRKNPSFAEVEQMEAKVKGNVKMGQYFEFLKTRSPNIAPPPRPNA